MRVNGKDMRTIWVRDDIVEIIDQTFLPHELVIISLVKNSRRCPCRHCRYESSRRALYWSYGYVRHGGRGS